jgi:16S rRNA (adenine1518-N6/adenine1519-N6)-dimethyltransferase
VRAIGPSRDDVVIEIGPGRGAITELLAAAAARVVAFEIDRQLAAALRAAGLRNVAVVEGDFLRQDPAAIRAVVGLPARAGSVRVAGNLPYNVASPILFKLVALVDAGLPIADATVMLQREVADRLVAPPGTKEYGVLTVLIGHRAGVDRLLTLPPGAFRPQPKVHSALVRLRFRPPAPSVRDEARFAALTQAIFTRRRKTLSNALLAYPDLGCSPADALNRAGIDGGRRPETLSIDELARLADV